MKTENICLAGGVEAMNAYLADHPNRMQTGKWVISYATVQPIDSEPFQVQTIKFKVEIYEW